MIGVAHDRVRGSVPEAKPRVHLHFVTPTAPPPPLEAQKPTAGRCGGGLNLHHAEL